MNDRNISIQGRIKQFASKAIKLYSFIDENPHFNSLKIIIFKHFLRSSTSINRNRTEAKTKLINKNKEKLLTFDF
jgi:hypothetical protein